MFRDSTQEDKHAFGLFIRLPNSINAGLRHCPGQCDEIDETHEWQRQGGVRSGKGGWFPGGIAGRTTAT